MKLVPISKDKQQAKKEIETFSELLDVAQRHWIINQFKASQFEAEKRALIHLAFKQQFLGLDRCLSDVLDLELALETPDNESVISSGKEEVV